MTKSIEDLMMKIKIAKHEKIKDYIPNYILAKSDEKKNQAEMLVSSIALMLDEQSCQHIGDTKSNAKEAKQFLLEVAKKLQKQIDNALEEINCYVDEKDNGAFEILENLEE